MAELAEFGVRIPPVEGGKDVVDVLQKIEAAATRAADDLDRLTGRTTKLGQGARETGDRLTNMQRAAGVLLSALGPLGREAQNLNDRFGNVRSALGVFATSTAAAAAGAVAFTGVLVALGVAVKTFEFGWRTLVSALRAGAEFETAGTRLEIVINNTRIANELLGRMETLIRDTGGQFGTSLPAMTTYAARLIAVGEGYEHVMPLIRGFTEIAARTGEQFSTIAEQYLAVAGALRNADDMMGRATGGRAMIQFYREGVDVFQLLADQMGVTRREATLLSQAGAINADTWTRVIESIGKQTDAVYRFANTTGGLFAQLQHGWHEVLQEFGRPIDVALSQILRELIPQEDTIIGKARLIGQAFADGLNTAVDAWRRGTLAELILASLDVAFAAAWEKFIEYGAKAVEKVFSGPAGELKQQAALESAVYKYGYARATVPQDAAGTWRESTIRGFAGVAEVLKYELTNKLPEGLEVQAQKQTTLLEEATEHLKAILETIRPTGGGYQPTYPGISAPLPGPMTNQQWWQTDLLWRRGGFNFIAQPSPSILGSGPQGNQPLTGTPPTRQPVGAPPGPDLEELIRLQTNIKMIYSQETTELERQRATFNAVVASANKMQDPLAHEAELLKLITNELDRQTALWVISYRNRMLQEQHWEMQARAGLLNFADTGRLALMKVSDSIGTWQTQMVSAIGQISDALATGISTGLTDILMGTKSVSEGFKDMARAIIQSIEQIILKMLVQLAIQQLISAMGGGMGIGAGFSGVTYGEGSAVSLALGPALSGAGLQTGGRIGGSGSGDKVALLAEPGEFMLNRAAAQMIGYDRLNEWNRTASSRGVRRMVEGGAIYAMTFGPIDNEYGPDETYGAWGMGEPDPHDASRSEMFWNEIAATPDLLRQYGGGSYLLIDGVWYHIADNSRGWFSGAIPYGASGIEFRDYDHGDFVHVQAVSRTMPRDFIAPTFGPRAGGANDAAWQAVQAAFPARARASGGAPQPMVRLPFGGGGFGGFPASGGANVGFPVSASGYAPAGFDLGAMSTGARPGFIDLGTAIFGVPTGQIAMTDPSTNSIVDLSSGARIDLWSAGQAAAGGLAFQSPWETGSGIYGAPMTTSDVMSSDFAAAATSNWSDIFPETRSVTVGELEDVIINSYNPEPVESSVFGSYGYPESFEWRPLEAGAPDTGGGAAYTGTGGGGGGGSFRPRGLSAAALEALPYIGVPTITNELLAAQAASLGGRYYYRGRYYNSAQAAAWSEGIWGARGVLGRGGSVFGQSTPVSAIPGTVGADYVGMNPHMAVEDPTSGLFAAAEGDLAGMPGGYGRAAGSGPGRMIAIRNWQIGRAPGHYTRAAQIMAGLYRNINFHAWNPTGGIGYGGFESYPYTQSAQMGILHPDWSMPTEVRTGPHQVAYQPGNPYWYSGFGMSVPTSGLPSATDMTPLGTIGGNLARRYDSGGIVDFVGAFQSGGVVKEREGVFTPEQMANLAPVGSGMNLNQISISVTNVGGRAGVEVSGGGMSDADTRQLARVVLAVVQSEMARQKRVGGEYYIPRSQRGG